MISTASDTSSTSIAAPSPRVERVKFTAVCIQLAALVLFAVAFQLESREFRYVLALSGAGFVVHHLLPLRYRLPFFGLLSVGATALALGLREAWMGSAWLLLLGLAFIGIAHLPIPFLARIALIVTGAGGLVMMRAGTVAAPWSGVLWPAFGSMFMFRGMIYLYDLKTRSAPFSFWRAVAYFFMLPSACFPLFPVVDYKSFQRCYYNGDAFTIYQKGLTWMLRGMLQLLLYRLLYRNAQLNPNGAIDAASAALFMVSTYLLYLKVSGSFHVIVGLLHLFGFNLSETHHRYLLSSSFTDFWRRINIYWKDFIQKLFFYPVFFRARRWGETPALVIATVIAFAVTWFLHAYQMFWVLGRPPVTVNDSLFWIILGILVLINVIYETKRKKKRRLKQEAWTWSKELARSARTIGVFATMTILWSLWTAQSVEQWLMQMAAFSNMTIEGALVIASILVSIGVGALWLGRSSSDRTGETFAASTGEKIHFWRAAPQTVLVTGALMLAVWQPRLLRFAPEAARELQNLRSDRLSARDGAMLARGYYEDLTNEVRFNPELWGTYVQRPRDWKEITETDAVSVTKSTLEFELIPNRESRIKGMKFTTNRWGMRDRDYTKEKPPATYRIGLIGSSRSVGSGVADGETFETLIEERLNRELSPTTGVNYEILNFAMAAHGPLKKLYCLETQVLEFDPDAILYVGHVAEANFILPDMARAATFGLDIPYEEIREVIRKAGADKSPMRSTRARLSPYTDSMSEWAWNRITRICQDRGIVAYMAMIPSTLQDPASRDRRTARVAEMQRHGFIAFDLSEAFQVDLPARDFVLAPWDGHPNALGQKLLADTLYAQWYPHLSKTQTPTARSGERE